MGTGGQDQRSEWIPGDPGVAAKGRTGKCHNPSAHLTDENTEGELGGRHLLGL